MPVGDDPVLRLSMFVLCLVGAALAAATTAENIAAARMVSAAIALERDSFAGDPEQVLNDSGTVSALRSCRSDLARAGLTVVLAALDRSPATVNFEAWSKAIDRTREFISRARACVPTDGNLRLRETMVEAAVVEDVGQIATGLTRSITLSPAEGLIMMARLDFLMRVQPSTRAGLLDQAAGDLGHILAAGTDAHLIYLIERMPAEWKDICEAALMRLQAPQRERVDHMWSVMTGRRENPEAYPCLPA